MQLVIEGKLNGHHRYFNFEEYRNCGVQDLEIMYLTLRQYQMEL